MKNRIRKAVEMITDCGAEVKNNLSALDFKLYSMSPSEFLRVHDIEFNDIGLNDFDAADNGGNLYEEQQNGYVAGRSYKGEEKENVDPNEREEVRGEHVNGISCEGAQRTYVAGSSYEEEESEYVGGNGWDEVRGEYINGIWCEEAQSSYVADNSYEDGQGEVVTANLGNENDSSYVMEFLNANELEDFMNTQLIVNEEDGHHVENPLQFCGTDGDAEYEDGSFAATVTHEDRSETFEAYPGPSSSNANFRAIENLPKGGSDQNFQRRVDAASAPKPCSKSFKDMDAVKVIFSVIKNRRNKN